MKAQNASKALTTQSSTPLEMCIDTTSRLCPGVFARVIATARSAELVDPKTASTARSFSTSLPSLRAPEEAREHLLLAAPGEEDQERRLGCLHHPPHLALAEVSV